MEQVNKISILTRMYVFVSERGLSPSQDVKAIQLVWDITNEWNEAWQVYKTANFWEIEMEQMETTANVLFRKLNRLSRELKDKNWEIVEHSRSLSFLEDEIYNNFVSIIKNWKKFKEREYFSFVFRTNVDKFRRTLPLITDLKNPAMRPRHWQRVKETVDRDFDELSPEFTLDAITEMEFQNFAEQISDISNSATMELAIEIVSDQTSFIHLLLQDGRVDERIFRG